MAANLNAMLARSVKLVKDIREAGRNIAYGLRTPLTRLRAEVELALLEHDPEAGRAYLRQIHTEVEGLDTSINAPYGCSADLLS